MPRRPDVLITRVDRRGRAALSRPLPEPLAAGPHAATTLRFAPFAPPRLPDGSGNPVFARTLRGWLAYVSTITRFAHRVLGGWRFDVEVWNELSFDSDFLDAGRYYAPAPAGHGDTDAAILARTVAWLRDRRHRIGPIGITDGFASETPFAAGSTSPRGLTALSKHPYVSLQSFPAAAGAHADQPQLSAGRAVGDAFTPAYDAYFPEYWLTGIQTETLLRDLAPVTSDIGGVAHGRATRPRGGRPPGMWITEFNLAPVAGLPTPAQAHARAKGLLRGLVAYVHAGVGAFDIYAATSPEYGLQPDALAALRRLTRALAGAHRRFRARPLHVDAVAGATARTEFAGDGTPANPPLYDRDLLAAWPFQLDARHWVVPVYVMTRDVRQDVPAAPFRVTLSGLDAPHAAASLYDPASGRFAPLRISARAGDRVTVELPVTDSVRLLYLAG